MSAVTDASVVAGDELVEDAAAANKMGLVFFCTGTTVVELHG